MSLTTEAVVLQPGLQWGLGTGAGNSHVMSWPPRGSRAGLLRCEGKSAGHNHYGWFEQI